MNLMGISRISLHFWDREVIMAVAITETQNNNWQDNNKKHVILNLSFLLRFCLSLEVTVTAVVKIPKFWLKVQKHG